MTLKVLSTLAVQGALPGLVTRFEARSGARVDVRFAPTNALLQLIATGERGDVAILTRAAVDDLAGRGVLLPDSLADIALSQVGIAVRAGAAVPDISTIEALKAALHDARSIAYSRIGASGVFFAELIKRLRMEEVVNAKATVIPGGLTAELAARGEVDLAVQQLSELMIVPGVEVVGPLPPGAQSVTMFAAGIFAGSANAASAQELIGVMRSGQAAPILSAAGLVPAS